MQIPCEREAAGYIAISCEQLIQTRASLQSYSPPSSRHSKQNTCHIHKSQVACEVPQAALK